MNDPTQGRNNTEFGSPGDRKAVLLELAAAQGVTDMEGLAAWLNVPATTLAKVGTRGFGRPTALKIIASLRLRGYTVTVQWLQGGRGPGPSESPSAEHKSRVALATDTVVIHGKRPAIVLDSLKQLKDGMQRATVVKAFARGLETSLDAQELHGSGLLRAALEMTNQLREKGFAPVAQAIESELLRALAIEELSNE